MSEPQRPNSTQQSANEIFAAANVERREREQRQAIEAARAPKPPSRDRLVLVSFIAAVPVFVAVLLINVFGFSPSSFFETPPSPDAARHQAQQMLDALVADIEAFRTDTTELPQSLIEVGVPPRGEWTYVPAGRNAYRVQGKLYGQAVSFTGGGTQPPSAKDAK
jgi:hypothetical protein